MFFPSLSLSLSLYMPFLLRLSLVLFLCPSYFPAVLPPSRPVLLHPLFLRKLLLLLFSLSPSLPLGCGEAKVGGREQWGLGETLELTGKETRE